MLGSSEPKSQRLGIARCGRTLPQTGRERQRCRLNLAVDMISVCPCAFCAVSQERRSGREKQPSQARKEDKEEVLASVVERERVLAKQVEEYNVRDALETRVLPVSAC